MTPPFTVGGIQVWRIVEMPEPFMKPLAMFPDATAEIIAENRHWLEPDALCPETGKLLLTIQAYLVRTSRHTLLIDTCVGCGKSNEWYPDWHQRTDTVWLDRLAAAGAAPEQIDYVFCTHLHPDHCGWNTRLLDGRWVPTFPKARYVMARTEVEYLEAKPDNVWNENVLPVIESGQALVVDDGYALDDEVWLQPTPGHTAGHVAVRLASKGREAVMTGDMIHSPIQCPYPDWAFKYDFDKAQAVATRRAVLEAAAEHRHLVMTAHFPAPSAGYVEVRGDVFKFDYLDGK